MRAVTVITGQAGSTILAEWPEPAAVAGAALVQRLALGICGTDREILDGLYGEAPAGNERMILGHESLGRGLEAPARSGLAAGDLVVPMVRHPDPAPCPSAPSVSGTCAATASTRSTASKGSTALARAWEHIERIGSERWLAHLITRRVPLDHWQQSFERQPHNIKVVIEFDSSAEPRE